MLGSHINQYVTKVKKLTLHSNPKIGDAGIIKEAIEEILLMQKKK